MDIGGCGVAFATEKWQVGKTGYILHLVTEGLYTVHISLSSSSPPDYGSSDK